MVQPMSLPPEEPDPDLGDGRINAMIRSLVANELDAIREALEQLGADLCCHPAIIEDYSHTLQSLDELAQRNENLARLLRSSVMEPAIGTITLESLRLRLVDGMSARLAGDGGEVAISGWTGF